MLVRVNGYPISMEMSISEHSTGRGFREVLIGLVSGIAGNLGN